MPVHPLEGQANRGMRQGSLAMPTWGVKRTLDSGKAMMDCPLSYEPTRTSSGPIQEALGDRR